MEGTINQPNFKTLELCVKQSVFEHIEDKEFANASRTCSLNVSYISSLTA